MKKLSNIILGFIIGVVLTYYFCQKECQPFRTPPPGLIDTAQADSLDNNWNKYRCKAVDSCIKVQTDGRKLKDNRWAEWSLKDIKNYLGYAEYQADSLGFNMTKIRVYLGVYGDNAGVNKKNLTTTMFIVPRGIKSQDKASMSLFNTNSMLRQDTNLPIPPLNRGTGGSGGYPN